MIDFLQTLQTSPDSWGDIARSLKGIHEAVSDNKSLLYSLLGIIGGGILSLVTMFITRTTSKRDERKALRGVLYDLQRHFHANMRVLDRIDPSMGCPSKVYFARFRVDDASMVFHDGICNSVKRKHLKRFNELRLLYRNGNIEAGVVCDYVESDNYDPEVMQQYLDMLRARQVRLRRETQKFYRKLDGHTRFIKAIKHPMKELRFVPIKIARYRRAMAQRFKMEEAGFCDARTRNDEIIYKKGNSKQALNH
jgi:hypothetical protein